MKNVKEILLLVVFWGGLFIRVVLGWAQIIIGVIRAVDLSFKESFVGADSAMILVIYSIVVGLTFEKIGKWLVEFSDANYRVLNKSMVESTEIKNGG